MRLFLPIQTNACYIDGLCYHNGQANAENISQNCNITHSNIQWTNIEKSESIVNLTSILYESIGEQGDCDDAQEITAF